MNAADVKISPSVIDFSKELRTVEMQDVRTGEQIGLRMPYLWVVEYGVTLPAEYKPRDVLLIYRDAHENVKLMISLCMEHPISKASDLWP